MSGRSDGFYNFWDVISGTPVRFCTASPSRRSENFDLIASAPNDLTAQRWECILYATNRWHGDPRVHNETHNRAVYISMESILVYDKASGTCIASLPLILKHPKYSSLSPSGKSILFWPPNSGYNYLWNIDTQIVYRLGKSESFGVWSPDGHYIAIGGHTLWDAHTGTLVSIFDFNTMDRAWLNQCFSPDGRYLVAAHGDRIKLWDMKIALLCGPHRPNPPLSLRDGILDLSN